MLQITLVRAVQGPFSIPEGYASLLRPISRVLSERGARATVQGAPGTVCDGKYNLCVGHRKICGTSQRWIPGNDAQGTGIALAHAVVFIDVEFEAPLNAVTAFYEDLGMPRRFESHLHTDCRASMRSRSSHRRSDASKLCEQIACDLRAVFHSESSAQKAGNVEGAKGSVARVEINQ
jgi:lipoate-protein ligase A